MRKADKEAAFHIEPEGNDLFKVVANGKVYGKHLALGDAAWLIERIRLERQIEECES